MGIIHGQGSDLERSNDSVPHYIIVLMKTRGGPAATRMRSFELQMLKAVQ